MVVVSELQLEIQRWLTTSSFPFNLPPSRTPLFLFFYHYEANCPTLPQNYSVYQWSLNTLKTLLLLDHEKTQKVQCNPYFISKNAYTY